MIKIRSSVIIFIIIVLISLSAVGYFVFAKKQIISSNSYIGVFASTANCMIPEGCGPKYKLLDANLQTYMPLLGDIKETDSGLIVKITGSKVVLPKSEYKDMNYRGPTEAIQVSSYTVMSKIPYHDFLVNKAGEYTMQKYPCLAHTVYGKIGTNYNRTFSWELVNDVSILKVKMTGDKGSYELSYDGNTGNFIKEVTEPEHVLFCQ